MTDPNATPASSLVAEKYELVRLIGRGGMGEVWEGLHVTLGTRVAIKFIDKELAESEEARARFRREARAAAQIGSRHVVGIFDHGVMQDGRPFIVMEFLHGESLEQRLQRDGVLSVSETALMLWQASKALSKAHEKGIIHRDIKPENIFLARSEDDDEQVVKVVDFGIAKVTNQPDGASLATKTGVVLGTPFFMCPEQARGYRDIDYRCDLFALGVVAYRCLTGELPFNGQAVGDILVKVCTATPKPPSSLRPDLPPAVDAWFLHATAKEPEDRFSTAKQLAESLMQVAGLTPADTLPNASAPHVVPGNGDSGTNDSASVVDFGNAPTQMEASAGKPLRGKSGLPSRRWIPFAVLGVLVAGVLAGSGLIRALRPARSSSLTPSAVPLPSTQIQRGAAHSAVVSSDAGLVDVARGDSAADSAEAGNPETSVGTSQPPVVASVAPGDGVKRSGKIQPHAERKKHPQVPPTKTRREPSGADPMNLGY